METVCGNLKSTLEILTWSVDAIQNTESDIQAQIKKSHLIECENSHGEIKNMSNSRRSRSAIDEEGSKGLHAINPTCLI